MIASIIENNKNEHIFQIAVLLNAQNKGFNKLDFLLKFIKVNKLSSLNKKYHYSKFIRENNSKKADHNFINHFISTLNKEEFNILFDEIFKNKEIEEIVKFLKKNDHLINKIEDLEYFKKIIEKLDDKTKNKLFEYEVLSEEKINILIDADFELRKFERASLKNICFYIERKPITKKILEYVFSKLTNSALFYDKKEARMYIKEIVENIFNNKMFDVLKEDKYLLGRGIDSTLIVCYNINNRRSPLWKLKKKYCEINNINNNRIFHDLNWFEEVDEFYKNNEYDFKNLTKNKFILKRLYEKTFQNNYIIPYYYRALNSLKNIFPNMDEQLMIPIFEMNTFDLKRIFEFEDNFKELNEKILNKYFSKNKSFNIITKELGEQEAYAVGHRYFQDIMDMHDRLKLMNWNGKLNKKHKSIVIIHDFLVSEIKKQSQENYYLNQEKINFLEGRRLGDFTIKVPQTNHDLIDVGTNLRICVGNGMYSTRVLKGELNIITLYENDSIRACVSFENGQIQEAKGRSNSQIKFDTSALLELIKEL